MTLEILLLESGRLIVPPRGAEPINPLHSSLLSDDEVADIRAGKRKIFFYGFLSYFDVFGQFHKTWFALSYSGQFVSNMPMGFVTVPGYNRFD